MADLSVVGWSKDLGPTEWAGSLSAVFFWRLIMHELSIFVDESGDFGKYAKHSPYYAVTMVFHDQDADIWSFFLIHIGCIFVKNIL